MAQQFSSPERAGLARYQNSFELGEAWRVGRELKDPHVVVRNPRRTSGDLREDMKGRGAFFLVFSQPGPIVPLDPFRGDGLEFMDFESFELMEHTSEAVVAAVKVFRKILDKGVLVTKTGCMIPHPQFCTPGEGARRKAHQHAMLALMGVRTVGTQSCVDCLGWLNWAEVSHICHERGCCNPLHLVLEACWRNRKRNYCGRQGPCDCAVTPSCVAPYKPTDTALRKEDLCSTTREVKIVLADLFSTFGFRLRTDEELDDLDAETAKQWKRRARRASVSGSVQKMMAINQAKRRKIGAYQGRKRKKRLAKKKGSAAV